MELLTLLAATEAEETSKTAFYVIGSALAAWAVVLSAIGLTQPSFPGEGAMPKIVIALSALLVAATLVAAIATS